MNVYFLYEDRDWANVQKYSDAQSIIQDLGLKTLFSISAKEVIREDGAVVSISPEDPFLLQTMKTVMMVPLCTENEILYRQDMIKDALKNSELICELYDLTGQMLKRWDDLGRKVIWKGNSKNSASKLVSDMNVLKLFVTTLRELKRRFGEEAEHFSASGFLTFYERLCEEFSEEKEEALIKILNDISFYAKELDAKDSDDIFATKIEAKPKIVLGCNLVQGLKCNDFVVEEVGTELRKFRGRNSVMGKVQDYISAQRPGAIPVKRVPSLQEYAANLEYEVVRYVVSACSSFIAQYNDFFDQLHFQLGFFRATINLEQHIKRFYLPFCYPVVRERDILKFEDLKEFVMAIEQRVTPIGNTCDISESILLVVTGANQGGKSTFLRSIGIAQIMMQCGLPVIAKQYESGIFPSFFTHFTRREDSAMNSGRLDEELKRMSQIIDNLGESSMVLLNESFATTTEKEGSVIAYDIIKALTEADVKILTVTHLLSFAQRLYQEAKENPNANIEFFSAERGERGNRTYRMIQHEPELTSFGMDLYEKIIGE